MHRIPLTGVRIDAASVATQRVLNLGTRTPAAGPDPATVAASPLAARVGRR